MKYFKVYYEYFVTRRSFEKGALEITITGKKDGYSVVYAKSKKEASANTMSRLCFDKRFFRPSVTNVEEVLKGY